MTTRPSVHVSPTIISDAKTRQQRMASEIAEDKDLYAKAPKINVRDFKRERHTSSPNETQLMAMVSN